MATSRTWFGSKSKQSRDMATSKIGFGSKSRHELGKQTFLHCIEKVTIVLLTAVGTG